MDITVFEQGQEVGLHGTAEVWLQVRSNDVVDLPEVMAKLDEDQARVLARCNPKPIAYHPHVVVEGEENPYEFEDWWVFRDMKGR